jgi:hypothetical protein
LFRATFNRLGFSRRLRRTEGTLGTFDRVELTSAFDAVDGSSTGTEVPWMWVLFNPHDSEEPPMQAVTTIGLDIAKSVFKFTELMRQVM